MTIKFEAVAVRSNEQVARLYVEARVAGVEISHYPSAQCRTFDAAPEPGCELGVFRTVGSVIFYKDERRWEARARADCDAVDLATLIRHALTLAGRWGRTPGHGLRGRNYTHKISKRTGKRIATAEVCYALTIDDLTQPATVAEAADLEQIVSTWVSETA